MIIHSPIISGSLTFADGATFTLPDNGIYSGSFSGSLQVHEVQSSLIPDASASYDLGSEAFPFRDLYVSSNTIKLGGIGIGAGIGGLNIKNNSDGSPAEVAAKSITIGGLLGGVGSKKFKLNDNNKIEVRDENDDIDSIEVKEIILKDTSGNGKNTVVKNDNGKFTTSEVDNDGTVTAVDSEGSLSGSFTGSIQDAEFNGDAIFNDNATITGNVNVTGPASLDGGLDVDGLFTVADTSGNVSTSGTLSVTGLTTVGVISGSNGDFTGNLAVGGNLTVAGAMTNDGHIIPALHNTYDLGSTEYFWRDLYLSSGSLYINGIQVLSTDGTDLTFQTDEGESTKILETANDTITLETVNGDITLTATGTGNIELDAPIQINAGKNILSSDGNAINFADDISLGVNSIYAANLVGVVSSSAITYDGNNIDVAGNTTIQGNLTVQGTQTILNTATLNIEDKNLLIASGAADSAAANGGGITIDGANATITWVSADSNIAFNTAVNIPASSLKLDGTAVTSTAAELNLLDGVSGLVKADFTKLAAVDATAAELNILEGATVTTAELNILDGVTATTAELNLLDGVTATTSELNLLDGVTATTSELNILAGVTATTSELNILAGVTSTATELNYVDGVTSAIQTQIDELFSSSSASNISGTGDTIPIYNSAGTAFADSIITQTAAEGEGNDTIVVAGNIDNRNGGNGEIATEDIYAETVIAPLIGTGPVMGGNLDISTTNTSSTQGHITITAANSGEIRLSGQDIESATDTTKKILVIGADGHVHTADGDEDVTFASVNVTDTTASTSNSTGAVTVAGGVGIAGALNVGGDVVAYASSDERLKDNIEVISNPIEKVQQLKGVTWDWNDNADELQKSLPNVGVIAQDVEKVLPQLVTDRDNGFKGVDYAKLTGLLIEAIKDQQTQIDELKSKLS